MLFTDFNRSDSMYSVAKKNSRDSDGSGKERARNRGIDYLK